MICVSIAEHSVGCCLEALSGLDLAEIRMEDMSLAEGDIQRIFSQPLKLIATCRPGHSSDEIRMQYLVSAIRAGASYVDVEIESESAWKREIIQEAQRRRCQVIMSFHDYEKTPGLERLKAIISQCFAEGADIAKIACMVRSEHDNARLLGLLTRRQHRNKLLVIGMGEKGKITRIVAPFFGSPFSYASLSKGKETAEGQIAKESLEAMMRGISDA
jgi:3-dehydroquinate dehydratase-1